MSHEQVSMSLKHVTREGLIQMVEQLLQGKRPKSDAVEEAEKKSRLHEEHKGRGNAPPVGKDDVEDPFGDDEGDEVPPKGKRLGRDDDEDAA